MTKINEENLNRIKGGTITEAIWTGIAIASIAIFISGIIKGLIKLKWQDLKNIVFIRNLSEKPLIQIRKKDSIMFIKS